QPQMPQAKARQARKNMLTVPRTLVATALLAPLLGGCGITARMEPYKQTTSTISGDEYVVILARKQHSTHEAEAGFIDCLSEALAKVSKGLNVHASAEFEDKMYPWFEPTTAPLTTDDLEALLQRPGV